MRQKIRLSSLVSWGTKGGLAILEYGLISGCNFLTSILLARWLSNEQYGAYALAFSFFLLLSVLYQSLVLEPMSVFAGAMPARSLGGYVRTLFWIHAALSIAVAVVLAIAAVVTSRLHMPALPSAFAGLALASPVILLFWLARRIYYIRFSPGPAVMGAFIYFFLVTGAVLALRSRLSPFLAFGLMGAGALLASSFLFLRLRSCLDWQQLSTLRDTWHEHWEYGRWAMVSAVLAWAPAYACYPLISFFRGMVGAGELKALMNVSAPVIQTFMALSVLVLPYAAGSQHDGTDGIVMCRRIAVVFITAGLAYWGLLMSVRSLAFRVMYGDKYGNLMHLLPLFALESIIWSATCGPTIVLRAMRSPKSVLCANLVATGVFVATGIPATRAFGIPGTISAIILADVAILVVALWLLRRKVALAQAAQPYNLPQVVEIAQ